MNIKFTPEYGTDESIIKNIFVPLRALSYYAYDIMTARYINAGANMFRNMCICPVICNPHFHTFVIIPLLPSFSLRQLKILSVRKDDIPTVSVKSSDLPKYDWKRRLALAYKISF